ncbi:MAG: twin-arginine translocase subunit TatC [Acidimicrobiales bacterium]
MTDTVAAPKGAPADDGRMSLMEHLIELRTRIIRCAIAIAVGAVVGWMIYFPVLDILRRPLEELSGDPNISDKFLSFDPLELFMLRIQVSAYLGIAIAMPFLLWQLWRFIAPGLYQNERRFASAFVFSATLLFIGGAAVAYYTLPQALKFLQSMGGGQVEIQYTVKNYITLIVYMMLAFGAGFQFPIVLVFLQLVGVVKPQQLRQFRRFGIVIIFVVAAIITPSADPISLFALALPMVVFYEISIVIGRIALGRRAAAEA